MTATTYSERRAFSDMRGHIEEAITEHRGWYIFQGIVFVLAGILAMVLPGATAFGFELLIGALLLISGIVQGVASLRSKTHWWALVSSLASLVIGGLMVFHPVAGALALATLLAVFLLVEGITELLLAFQFRSLRNWGWLMASGLVSLVLAGLLFAGWPGATVMFLGIIIGINLLFYGISLLALTASIKH